MARSSPTSGVVHDDTLVYQHDGRQELIPVGTPAWQSWLGTATSFTFKSHVGSFTAHKTRASNRRGGWYWYAYRRRRGHLSNLYLGTSAKLSLHRLYEAARTLALRAGETAPEPPAPVVVAPFPPAVFPTDDDLVLVTKLHIPRLPVQHIARPHLLALLEHSTRQPLTLVSAPAGSGKTTLLAEWATVTAFPVTWLALEAADNDPARFLAYLMAALARLDARIGTAAWTDRPAPTHAWEPVLTRLLNDVARLLEQDAVVILDDVHLISSEAIHALLQFLLNHLPAHLHLILGTRVDPPLPLARLRARNQLSEVRTEELSFVSAEVEALVHAMGLTLSREAMRMLEQRTEGWIAGVQLLLLALRGQADAAAFLQAFSGSHRVLLDYVSEEILAQQTPEMQRFLLRTCILDRLCGSLCDLVTGEPDGQERLAALLRANLFLSALDDTQTWYRYHPLFAEALRAHLQKREPDLVADLYRRASHWYEQQHWEEQACEYAFLAGDHSRAAALLAELVPYLIAQGKVLRLGQWLAQLSPALIADSPLLSVAAIWTQMLRKNTLENAEQVMGTLIEHFEQQIERHAQDAEPSWTELQPGLPLLQAMAALGKGDVAQAISLALETSPARSRPESALSQSIALARQMVLGAAYRASGDLDAAEQILLEAGRSGDSSAASPLAFFATPGLAELYEAQGQLRKLGQLYDDLFQPYAQRSDPSPVFLALMQARHAALLYEWNRLTEADARAQQALELSQGVDLPAPVVSMLSLATQVRIALAQGSGERARHLLERNEFDLAQVQIPEQGKRALSAIPARLALACGLLEHAERWVATHELRFDDPLEPQLSSHSYFEYITLARVLLARGRSQRNGPRLAQALILLERLRGLTSGTGLRGWFIEIQMLTALALHAQGKTKPALSTLGPVLAQAEGEGYVRLFADEGQPIGRLLAQIAAYTTASPGYIQRLQAARAPIQRAAPDQASPAQRQPLLDPLSSRERDVLALLAEGLSNQHIADQLVISLNTAKRHVKHILAKLAVTNRTQAVARARELQLL
jgi:LuxR family maltose regulon positive regulatory protein